MASVQNIHGGDDGEDDDGDDDGDDGDDDDDHDVANLEAKWAKPVHGRSDYQSP